MHYVRKETRLFLNVSLFVEQVNNHLHYILRTLRTILHLYIHQFQNYLSLPGVIMMFDGVALEHFIAV